jgi:hypothetical protein
VLPVRYELNLCNIEEGRPPLWSSGQSSWLQIQRSRVRFLALPDFLTGSGSVTGSSLVSLVSTIKELYGINGRGSGLENREYGHGDPLS